jgi:hypothetical protein
MTASAIVLIVLVAVVAASSATLVATKLSGPKTTNAPSQSQALTVPVSSMVRLACTEMGAQTVNALHRSDTNAFEIDPATGCLNGRTPYEKTATGFTRIMMLDRTTTISVMDLSSDLAQFRRKDFVLTPYDYAAFRGSAKWSEIPRCEPGSAATLAHLREAAVPYVSGAPNRQTTWTCSRG